MKKPILIISIIIFIGIIGGFLYWSYVTSPKYSLLKIKDAIDQHDITAFEKYVDVEGLALRALTELPGIVSAEKGANFLGEEGAQVLLGVVKDSLTRIVKESVRTFVERGHFSQSLTDSGIISKVLKQVPIESFKVLSMQELRKEGKICIVPLNIQVEDYDGNAVLEFMMRDKGNYWQIAEISNLGNFIDQISELHRTFPYRNLHGTSIYLVHRSPDSNDNVKTYWLGLTAYRFAKMGDRRSAEKLITEALQVANSARQSEYGHYKEMGLVKIACTMVILGEIDKARQTAGTIRMSEGGNAYEDLGLAFAQAGNFDEALDIAKTKVFDRRSNLLALIAGELEKVDPAKAEDLLTESIRVANSEKKAKDRGRRLAFIAQDFNNQGNVERAQQMATLALEVAGEIEKEDDRELVLSLVVSALSESNYQKAEEVVDLIRRPGAKIEGLRFIVNSLKDSGKHDEAKRVALKTFEIAKSLDSLNRNEHSMLKLGAQSETVEVLCRAEKVDLAREIINSIGVQESMEMLKNTCGNALATSGKYKEALNIQGDSGSGRKDNLLYRLAESQLQTGQLNEALTSAEAIDGWGIRDSVLASSHPETPAFRVRVG